MRKVTATLLVIAFCCLVQFFPTSAEAQISSTQTGTITQVGQVALASYNVNYSVILFTPTGSSTSTAYALPSVGTSSNSMLAVALTALSSGKQVTCQFDASNNLLVIYMNSTSS